MRSASSCLCGLAFVATLAGGCGGGDDASAPGTAGGGGSGGGPGGSGGAVGGSGGGGCSDSLADCNDDPADGCEVDTSLHAQHCGACGRSCFGGVCVTGECQPVAIATVGDADDLTLRAGFAYTSHTWSGYVDEVRLEPGSSPSAISLQEYPGRVAATDTFLYFSTDFDVPNSVSRYAFQGGGIDEVAAGTMYYSDLQVHQGLVAWIDSEQANVRVLDTAGSLDFTGPCTSNFVAARAGRAAWIDAGGVYVLDSASGSQPSKIADAPGSSGAIALSDDEVFFENGGVLRQVALASKTETDLAPGVGKVDQLALTSSRVYFISGGAVSWVPRSGGSVHPANAFASKVATFDGGATWIDAGLLVYQADTPEPQAAPTCGELFADCNGNPSDGCETAIWSDPNHCGACDNACDGPCRQGACQPVVLAQGMPVSGLEVGSDQVVWADYDAVYTVPKLGGPVTQLATTDEASGELAIYSIAVTQDQVVYASDKAIRKVPVTGGTPTVLFQFGYDYGVVAADGADVYYTAGRYVYRLPIAGGTPTPVFDGTPFGSYGVDPLRVAVEGGKLAVLAFVAGPEYHLFGVDGATTELQFADPYQEIAGLLVDGNRAVVAHNFDAGLFAEPLGGGALTRWSVGEGAAAIAKDGTHFYWIGSTPIHCDQGCDYLYAMNRVTKAGGTPEKLFDIPGYPDALLAVDDANLYYSNDGYILRRSKTP